MKPPNVHSHVYLCESQTLLANNSVSCY